MKKMFIIISSLFLSHPVFAKSFYFNMLLTSIPNAQLTNKCQTCHGSAGLNAFGRDFSKVKTKLGNNFSTTFWLNLKDLDSDKDGINNSDEVLVGRNPGVKDK